jgi:hypothetical protein
MRSLQTQNEILKKLSEHQIYQSGQNFFQKKCAQYLKKEKEPKIRLRATRRNMQAQLKIVKKSSKHQINQSERTFSQKTYVSYLKILKEPKIRSTEFAGSTQNVKKN